MKIEIGESLIYSYLRQVNNCTITQTNWKPSTNWKYSKISYKKVEETFSLIKSNDSLSDVFPSEISQTIKQAEIDVIGINYDTVYAVDIAYHENGLNYGDKEETRVRVIKKLLRTLLILDLYFPEFKHIIMFCSPKVNPATEKNIQEYIDIIRNNFSNEKNDFVYLSNQNFYKNIIEPTIIKTESEADTSELFIRSYKLLGLFKEDNFVSKERNNEEINIKDSIYTKNDAIELINISSKFKKEKLDNNNVVFSNINSFRNVWWLEPSNQKFETNLYIVLNNESKRQLFLFYIPANSIDNPKSKLAQRKDKENISKIMIDVSDEIFKDERTNFDFTKFLIEKINY